MVSMQMGVQRIFLDAADTTAFKVWTSPSLGFSQIDEATLIPLCHQYTLVHNTRQNGLERCIKLIPSQEELMSQVLLPAYTLHTSNQDCTPVCPTSMRLQPPPACLPTVRLPQQHSKRTCALFMHATAVRPYPLKGYSLGSLGSAMSYCTASIACATQAVMPEALTSEF